MGQMAGGCLSRRPSNRSKENCSCGCNCNRNESVVISLSRRIVVISVRYCTCVPSSLQATFALFAYMLRAQANSASYP